MIIKSKMISPIRLQELKQLFSEDGFELSDRSVLEIGLWLLERAKSVAVKIPYQKIPTFKKTEGEMVSFQALHKGETVRHANAKPCKET